MNIDLPKIQAELAELAIDAVVKVKTNRHQQSACSISVHDDKRQTMHYDISFNPGKIRSETTLNKHLDWCKREVIK